MYGLMIRLDEFERDNLSDQVDDALAEVGFDRISEGIYICPNPQHTEMLVVHDAIEMLRKLPWFAEAAEQVVAFKVDSWGDITNAIKE